MVIKKSVAEARKNSRSVKVNNRSYILSGYVGAAPTRGSYLEGNEENDNGLPQGFLVEQPPSAETKPHFHETNQFQVIVGGRGTFGKAFVSPISIQYANSHTPYGPIVSGEYGLTYFTLRSKWDPGAKYMPGSRDKLIAGNQRARLVAGLPLDSEDSLLKRKHPTIDVIIPEEPDRLAVWKLCLGPKQNTLSIPPAGSGGQYMIVLAGTMLHLGSILQRLSVIFLTADEAPLKVTAGEDGLGLLILQFPKG